MTKRTDHVLWCPGAVLPAHHSPTVRHHEQRDRAVMLLLKGKRVEFHVHSQGVTCPGLADIVADEDGVTLYPDNVCWAAP